ncbi:hypothetical protein WMY93_027617 [Mugilogobius chulae]|uniref:Targeting protein for Xklp2 n=1 Tax=Mugilogobius chulae TaxID=88201 RepID=A0AAW0N5R9_9GOBI
MKAKALRATQSASSLHKTSSEPSSEELELERMKKLQREVALHRKKNEASYKAALAGNPPVKKMTYTTTVPREFSFKTDARLKSSASTSAIKEVNFMEQLRKPSSPAKAAKGPTVPKPFHLSSSRKRKVDEPQPYVPMAQQIQQFEKRTPDRFHHPSRQTQERGPSPVKSAPHKATVKEPTVPEGFHLQIEKRLQERQAKKPPVVVEEEEPPHVFKSHPVSKKILEGVVGVPEKKLPTLTVPESPAFALKKRVRMEPAPAPVKPPPPSKPLPSTLRPALPAQTARHHQVELCPFSFDKREQERRALKEKKLEQMRNEDIQEEKKQQEEATHFKARPNVVTHKEPFKPKKEERADTSLSSSSSFQLLTERRARERQEFDRALSEKEALRALMEEQRRKEEEEREREEIARMRQEQVSEREREKEEREREEIARMRQEQVSERERRRRGRGRRSPG